VLARRQLFGLRLHQSEQLRPETIYLFMATIEQDAPLHPDLDRMIF
jgi:hypothetical protein